MTLRCLVNAGFLHLFIYFPATILHQHNAVPSVLTLNRLKSICFDLKLEKKSPQTILLVGLSQAVMKCYISLNLQTNAFKTPLNYITLCLNIFNFNNAVEKHREFLLLMRLRS